MEKRMGDVELLERLRENPEIRESLEGLLLSVADEEGELGEADAMELKLIEEMRQMGRVSLKAWAECKMEREVGDWRARPGIWREGKKNCAGTRRLER